MALTPSNMLPLGTPAPDFTLPEPRTGDVVGLSDFADADALVVVFMCNHCPFVVHVRDELAAMARDFAEAGVAMVGINSNDYTKYPADSPEAMVQEAHEYGYEFPYLLDETQEVAKAYSAACTPDFYVFDGERKLCYRGQMDDSRPSNGKPVTGKNLRDAVAQAAAGKPVPEPHKPSIGCNIKWKAER